MADYAAISRVAKILARATSENEAEAKGAIAGAYARMKHDGVTVRDLLTLPEQELFQNTLIRLIDTVVNEQKDLSRTGQRDLYAAYVKIIVEKFSGQGSTAKEPPQASPRPPPREESNHQRNQDREAQSEEYTYKRKYANTSKPPEEKPAKTYTATVGKWQFSFSPVLALREIERLMGRGTFIWCVITQPVRSARLFGLAVCFAILAGFGVLSVATVIHGFLGVGPLIDIRVKTAFWIVALPAFLWKIVDEYRKGWYR